jgi:hypothetical protein
MITKPWPVKPAKFAVFTGLAALNVGLGISARKQHEDNKEDLLSNINKIMQYILKKDGQIDSKTE